MLGRVHAGSATAGSFLTRAPAIVSTSARQLHPEYRVAQAMRLRERLAAKQQVVDPLEMPVPLSGLPWQVAQKHFGVQGADFLAQFGRLLVREAGK